MIQHFLRRIVRGYLSNKVFTLINLIGISVGLSVAHFAVNYLYFEFSFDDFHRKSANIYRLANSYRSQAYSVNGFPEWSDTDESKQKNWLEALKSTNGVADATQFMISPSKEFIEIDQKRIETDAILTTNSAESFTKIFDWDVVAGSFQSFYNGTNTVILTESVAKKLIGKSTAFTDIINRSIKVANKNVRIACVIKDIPKNSHFGFSLALNVPKIDYWGSRIYVEANPQVSVQQLEKQLNQSIASFNPKLSKDPLYGGHFLQPIGDIHLKSDILYESKPPGNYTYLLLIGLFAVFTVLITIFNYTNLTLAIKSKQHKTIGVLKIVGANNENIAFQFVVEIILLCLIALPFAISLIMVVTPFFNQLMGVALETDFLNNYHILLLLLGLVLVMGLVASIAPVVLLARKNIILLFKGGLQKTNLQGLSIRKYLIITQFAFLITIASITYFTSQQITFINQKDLGFRKTQLLFAYTSAEKQAVFQQKLRQIPEILHVGNGSNFGVMPFNQMTYQLEKQKTIFSDARQLYLDFEALKAYGIKTDLVGRPNQTRKTIINRTAAKQIAQSAQIPIEQLIGKTIITEPEYTNPANGQVGVPFVIDGIFEDIHLFSLREKIEPYFITISDEVRLDGRTIVSYQSAQAINKIRQAYKELDEPFPLEIVFLEDNINRLYEQENRLNKLFKYFSLISIFLASLGIIGVTLFLTRIRIKEIGIRKILGASAFSLALLSIKEYIPLIIIALAISFPVIYFTTDKWLSEFAYQYDIQYFTVIPISLMVFVIAILLVGIIATRAALTNPVKSLKTD